MGDLIVSPAARADLLAQWGYFADEVQDIDLADHFLRATEQTFRTLARSPGMGRPRKFSPNKLKGLRSWRVDGFPKYLIFYRPQKKESGVEIVRVLHGMRDLERMFGEEKVQ